MGHVEVYALNNGVWLPKGQHIGGYGIAANFGSSVDINEDGNTIIGGGEEGVFGGTGGYVRVFDWEADNWIQIGDSIRKNIPYTEFGSDVQISNNGNIIAVGAQGEYDTINNIFDAGSVSLFKWSGTSWEQMGKFYGLNEQENLGRPHSYSLSDDGERIVIGYSLYNGALGKVEVLQWESSSSSWIQIGTSLEGAFARFGDGVNISGDGSVISVTGDYGIQMFTYQSSTDSWKLIGNKISEPEANVGYGFLSHDGSILSLPGTLIIPDWTFVFTSLVRFYEYDGSVVHTSKPISQSLDLFPNPSSGIVQLKLEDAKPYQVIITDLLGKTVKRFKCGRANNTIDLSNYSRGVYVVSILDEETIIAQKKTDPAIVLIG